MRGGYIWENEEDDPAVTVATEETETETETETSNAPDEPAIPETALDDFVARSAVALVSAGLCTSNFKCRIDI